MLAGRNDVTFPASIVKRMEEYSDDGKTMQGAYGYRWRKHFGFDQITTIVEALKKNPTCRRQVMSMWDAANDLRLQDSKDLPCNTQIYFSRNNEKQELDMTVCNRSNDIVWGALGANAVHMSFLQEFMALWIGCGIGRYYQFSNNMHLYLDHHEELMNEVANEAFPSNQRDRYDYYSQGLVSYRPMMPPLSGDKFFDAADFLLSGEDLPLGVHSRFMSGVAGPMLKAIRNYKSQPKETRGMTSLQILLDMPPNLDWTLACCNWLQKRMEKNG
ncbi:MAG: hypothetical protein KAR40_06280 [Candidatus Sabulitectum sp.]|nr:hypothetical protein [Candidatus Sabulitectum sp.]